MGLRSWELNFLDFVACTTEGPCQCWTEGRSSTAVAEDFRPTATATVSKVLGHSYGRRKNLNFL